MKTMRYAAIAAILLAAAPAAMANPNDGGPLPGCSPSGQNPPKCDDSTPNDPGNPGNGGGNGGNGGNGTGVGVGVGIGIGGGADVDNTNTNTNTNTQGQLQGQIATGGNATGGNATGGSVTGSGNSTNTNDNSSSASATGGTSSATGGSSTSTNSNNSAASGNTTNVATTNKTKVERPYRYVGTAYAPTVVGAGGSDSCLGSMSGGGQTGLFGLSLGGTTKDEACRTIKLSRRAEELGLPDVACQILALDPKFNEGLRRAGRDCSLSNFEGRMVPTGATATVPVGGAAVIPVIQQATPVQVPAYPERG